MASTLGRADGHDGAITDPVDNRAGMWTTRAEGQDAAAAGALLDDELLVEEPLEELSLLLLLDEAAEPLDSDLLSVFVSVFVSGTVAPERLSVR
jgi:hypothetical protein